jgi:hypothetical protein
LLPLLVNEPVFDGYLVVFQRHGEFRRRFPLLDEAEDHDGRHDRQ